MRSRGLRLVAASSAKADELEGLLKVCGADGLLEEQTSSDDADQSKPDPDIVQAALAKIALPAGEVIMLGDTPYDVEAAAKAGVAAIALLCGGWTRTSWRGPWPSMPTPPISWSTSTPLPWHIPRHDRDGKGTGMASSGKAVYAAIAADVAVAVAKFVAAGFTGSASMLAEGVHSLIDTSNGLLLLWGDRASRRPADEVHPFGHGKEQYFWSLIVALLIFALGGGVTTFRGIQSLLDPGTIESPAWNYAVLAVSALFDGYAWLTARRQLRSTRRESNLLHAAAGQQRPINIRSFV